MRPLPPPPLLLLQIPFFLFLPYLGIALPPPTRKFFSPPPFSSQDRKRKKIDIISFSSWKKRKRKFSPTQNSALPLLSRNLLLGNYEKAKKLKMPGKPRKKESELSSSSSRRRVRMRRGLKAFFIFNLFTFCRSWRGEAENELSEKGKREKKC